MCSLERTHDSDPTSDIVNPNKTLANSATIVLCGVRIVRSRPESTGDGVIRSLRTTPDDSGWLRLPTTPDNSEQLHTTPYDSGRLRSISEDSERLRIMLGGPAFWSRFQNYRRLRNDCQYYPSLVQCASAMHSKGLSTSKCLCKWWTHLQYISK